MAKFAEITYGSQGESGSYLYIVNDSVKVGDVVYPTFHHIKANRECHTMGIVQSNPKLAFKKGINPLKPDEKEPTKAFKEEMAQQGVSNIKKINTGNEVGAYTSQFAEKQTDEKGKIIGISGQKQVTSTKQPDGVYRVENPSHKISDYGQAVGKGTLDKGVETFDSYSKKFTRGN